MYWTDISKGSQTDLHTEADRQTQPQACTHVDSQTDRFADVVSQQARYRQVDRDRQVYLIAPQPNHGAQQTGIYNEPTLQLATYSIVKNAYAAIRYLKSHYCIKAHFLNKLYQAILMKLIHTAMCLLLLF